MLSLTLTGVLVNDQDRARKFYVDVLGFKIKHDIPMGGAQWLTVVSPGATTGTELLLEPTGHPASVVYQKALYDDGIPATAFASDDIRADFARLVEKGVVFKSEPTDTGDAVVAAFDDTCGNYIQLFEIRT